MFSTWQHFLLQGKLSVYSPFHVIFATAMPQQPVDYEETFKELEAIQLLTSPK